ncbi:polysaccharide deacetylase family protein [Clostridium sp. AL.422]|uniref:polysaccharide deacetylase family protein n=1 Tax=Clostridium TaxID=1485 RepID=UPI00293DCDF0|nr:MULTISPECIES: polysaccharide deacetylase family protein [unclassified Clostridium]MDV4150615.1 polysaccharide deacetylase family protein [Clostridium sp. AL.422]
MNRRHRVGLSLFLLLSTVIVSIFFTEESKLSLAEIKSDKPIYRVKTEEKILALTFDINWAENDELYNILEVLDKYNVKATFFIMGGWVNYSEENKDKLIKIKEGGHEIGNHSYKHPMFSNITEERMREELEKTNKIIKDTIGEDIKLFRFPSGDYNKKSCEFIYNNGMISIQWDVDSLDWKQISAESEYDRVMKKVSPGSIALFHNNGKYTPGNLDKIISELLKDDYKFVKVGEMIYYNDYYIDEKGEQIKK